MSVLPSPDDFQPEPVRYAELAVTSNFRSCGAPPIRRSW